MRRASLLIMCLAGFTLVGKAVADDAGIWQFLLGQGRGGGGYNAAPAPQTAAPPMPYGSQPYGPHGSHASIAPRIKKKAVVHLHIARPKEIAHADLPQKGPVSIYKDRTLRRGDAVMTAQGLRVFKGASHFPYKPADFVALAEASKFVLGDKKQLRDVQLAFERIEVPTTRLAALTTGRSVAVASAATTVDSGGKKIRYVGP